MSMIHNNHKYDIPDVEHLLASMRPARPSPRLRQKIATGLERVPWNVVRPAFWLSVPIAAAAALIILLAAPSPVALHQPQHAVRVPKPVSPAGNDTLRPVQFNTTLVAKRDEGTVLLSGNTPARKFRYSFVDTFEWKDETSGSLLSHAAPRDEVVLLAMDTY